MGRTYINNGEITKYVKKEELEFYLSNGWEKGKFKSPDYKPNRIRINNGKITKNIVIKYLDFYLKNGWVIGALKKKDVKNNA